MVKFFNIVCLSGLENVRFVWIPVQQCRLSAPIQVLRIATISLFKIFPMLYSSNLFNCSNVSQCECAII